MNSHLLPVSLEPVIGAGRAAADLIVALQAQGLSAVRAKSSTIDLVTEADLASEELLRERLTGLDPSIGFWGEEANGGKPQSDYYWLVDPIDGTVNYASGLPWYAVNIALLQDETPLLGVTLELPAGRLYWAVRGGGAYRQELDGSQRRLQVNGASRLDQSLISTGFPYHRASHGDNNSLEFGRLMRQCRGVRRMGAVALDLAQVAAGSFAAHWEAWFNPWDVAAGVLLVEEAGGRVTSYQGAPWRTTKRSLLASNGQVGIHDTLLAEIRHARQNLADSYLED